jgi:hypothetical protein
MAVIARNLALIGLVLDFGVCAVLDDHADSFLGVFFVAFNAKVVSVECWFSAKDAFSGIRNRVRVMFFGLLDSAFRARKFGVMPCPAFFALDYLAVFDLVVAFGAILVESLNWLTANWAFLTHR